MYALPLVFRNYDPNFMAASLDEAYLDITEVCREKGLSGGEVSRDHDVLFLFIARFSLCKTLADNNS